MIRQRDLAIIVLEAKLNRRKCSQDRAQYTRHIFL
jgi:hypothetical protein